MSKVILELDQQQARILMQGSRSNLTIARGLLKQLTNRESGKKIIDYIKTFSTVREQLQQQGINDNDETETIVH